jgi:hypothetical protein
MSATWAVVAAALGSAALTGLASVGALLLQERKRQRAEAKAARRHNYAVFLARSWGFLQRAQALADMSRLRTGFGEGLDIILRLRKPIDLREIHDWLNVDWSPLIDAYSDIQATDSQEVIDAASLFVQRCGILIDVGAPTLTGWRAKVRVATIGLPWTPEQRTGWRRALEDCGEARRGFITVARDRLGQDSVDLLAIVEK